MPDVTMRLLFVCTGNTCRSPMAEALARREAIERGLADVDVNSAGTSAWDGAPASDGALLVAMVRVFEPFLGDLLCLGIVQGVGDLTDRSIPLPALFISRARDPRTGPVIEFSHTQETAFRQRRSPVRFPPWCQGLPDPGQMDITRHGGNSLLWGRTETIRKSYRILQYRSRFKCV
jgi:hypothetical protein